MKKKLLVVLVSFLLLVVIAVGSFCYLRNLYTTEAYTKEYYSYEFKIEITPQSLENFTLYLPVPITEDGNISGIVNKSQIDGNITIDEIIDTEQGKALKLSGSGRIVISAEGDEKYPEAKLSMMNVTPLWIWLNGSKCQVYNFWIYCNKTLNLEYIEIYVVCRISHKIVRYNELGGAIWGAGLTLRSEVYKTTITENGWQTVYGTWVRVVT